MLPWTVTDTTSKQTCAQVDTSLCQEIGIGCRVRVSKQQGARASASPSASPPSQEKESNSNDAKTETTSRTGLTVALASVASVLLLLFVAGAVTWYLILPWYVLAFLFSCFHVDYVRGLLRRDRSKTVPLTIVCLTSSQYPAQVAGRSCSFRSDLGWRGAPRRVRLDDWHHRGR